MPLSARYVETLWATLHGSVRLHQTEFLSLGLVAVHGLPRVLAKLACVRTAPEMRDLLVLLCGLLVYSPNSHADLFNLSKTVYLSRPTHPDHFSPSSSSSSTATTTSTISTRGKTGKEYVLPPASGYDLLALALLRNGAQMDSHVITALMGLLGL